MHISLFQTENTFISFANLSGTVTTCSISILVTLKSLERDKGLMLKLFLPDSRVLNGYLRYEAYILWGGGVYSEG